MSLRRQAIKSGVLLSGDQVINQSLRLVRNVIVASTLTDSEADFGIAALFWITTGFLNIISELGFKTLIIQAKEGDDREFGATIQLMVLFRSLVISALIFLLAEPIAAMFDSPQIAWAFRLLAIVPALDGLRHMDMIRLQRELSFAPAIASKLGPTIVTTALAWPIAKYLNDYSVFVWLAIIQTGLSVLMSHLLAKRPFRLKWDWTVAKRAFDFGWPLLLNSMLMYAVLQGNPIILARAYTKAQLGVYSVAFGLAMTPGMMVISIGTRLLLPILSKF